VEELVRCPKAYVGKKPDHETWSFRRARGRFGKIIKRFRKSPIVVRQVEEQA